MTVRPTLAVWKFASCDGCQLTLLDCEDEFLAVVGAVDIAYFPEASRAMRPGPYDISIIEGSVTTPDDIERLREIRRLSGTVATIGACATSGGIQALRNGASVAEFARVVYAHPEFIETLDTSTPISDHIDVDHELRGCPISKAQLLELIGALVTRRRPDLPTHSVCLTCKQRGITCVMVRGRPCLGPVTQTGCGAICPAFDRGCYGCFGPAETPNLASLEQWWSSLGVDDAGFRRALSTFAVNAPEFKEVVARG